MGKWARYGYNTSQGILDPLQSLEVTSCHSMQNRITVVYSACHLGTIAKDFAVSRLRYLRIRRRSRIGLW